MLKIILNDLENNYIINLENENISIKEGNAYFI